MIASESPALAVVGAKFVREIEPGEMVVIDEDGPHSSRPWPADEIDPRLCLFEFVYFARPDSLLHGREVYAARRRMGERLADQAPVEADLVMGVPDSGASAAEGYSARSGIPFGQGLVKNRYIGRTFIAPTPEARALGVRRKLNPLSSTIAGKRLVVIDDSIVRGTTTRQLVKLLREAGAAEVHLRISSPPFRWPCFYGIDTPDRDELLGRPAHDRGDDGASGCRLARLSFTRAPHGGSRCSRSGAGLLRRLPHRPLPDRAAGRRPAGRPVSGRRGAACRPGGLDDPLNNEAAAGTPKRPAPPG